MKECEFPSKYLFLLEELDKCDWIVVTGVRCYDHIIPTLVQQKYEEMRQRYGISDHTCLSAVLKYFIRMGIGGETFIPYPFVYDCLPDWHPTTIRRAIRLSKILNLTISGRI